MKVQPIKNNSNYPIYTCQILDFNHVDDSTVSQGFTLHTTYNGKHQIGFKSLFWAEPQKIRSMLISSGNFFRHISYFLMRYPKQLIFYGKYCYLARFAINKIPGLRK